jgi:hypothetical protein
MQTARKVTPESHVVDILGSTKGRDQPIMLVEKALQLASCLSESSLKDQDVVLFDPFCKAGEIILATALKACVVRASRTKPLATDDEIAAEIYGGRYYALAPDERHYLLSRRTFYGNERSHDNTFATHIRNGNYVSEVDGTLNESKFVEELKSMIAFIKKNRPGSRIVAVGNPPYQETDGGARASAKPVYNFFVEQLMDCSEIDEFSLVIPARWFAGGKGLDPFRERIAKSNQVKTLHYFERSEDVFPTVHVQGGVCFLHWRRDHNGNARFVHKDGDFDVNLSRYDIIPDDPQATSIIEKILNSKVKNFVSDYAWSRKPFGLPTNFFADKKNESREGSPGSIPCMVKGRKMKFVSRAKIEINKEHIDKWKVAIPGAYATGARRCTLPKHQFFLLKKGEVATETYNVISSFDSKGEAERLIKYLQTDFVRYLLGLRKITQHIPKDRWSWVPYMDVTKEWTDEALFEFFGLSKKECEHIKKKVQEWS